MAPQSCLPPPWRACGPKQGWRAAAGLVVLKVGSKISCRACGSRRLATPGKCLPWQTSEALDGSDQKRCGNRWLNVVDAGSGALPFLAVEIRLGNQLILASAFFQEVESPRLEEGGAGGIG